YEEACADFFRTYSSVDIAARGEGETVLADLLSAIAEPLAAKRTWVPAVAQVLGITFRAERDHVVRNGEGSRIRDLDTIPSPYLSGFFDRIGRHDWKFVVQETNRGCPYGCTFCDWGSATLQKIYQFSLERVQDEIRWFAKNHIGDIVNADANF